MKGVDAMLTIKQISDAAETVAKEFPILSISLFGSYADGRNTPNSDVDLLIEFKNVHVSLLTLISIKYRFEDLLGVSVDVIHAPIPKDSILEINKVVPLYAA